MIPVICVGVILSIYCIKALNLLAARGELRSNDGIKYSTSPDAHFRIDDVADRNRDGLLRPGRLSRACRSSRGPYVV